MPAAKGLRGHWRDKCKSCDHTVWRKIATLLFRIHVRKQKPHRVRGSGVIQGVTYPNGRVWEVSGDLELGSKQLQACSIWTPPHFCAASGGWRRKWCYWSPWTGKVGIAVSLETGSLSKVEKGETLQLEVNWFWKEMQPIEGSLSLQPYRPKKALGGILGATDPGLTQEEMKM